MPSVVVTASGQKPILRRSARTPPATGDDPATGGGSATSSHRRGYQPRAVDQPQAVDQPPVDPWHGENIMWGLLGLPDTGGNPSRYRVGSICSGMRVAEHEAFVRLPWIFKTVFWCEKGQPQRQFIAGNFDEPDVQGFDDVMSEEFSTNAPPCDLLLAGFPCQPFSIAGRGDGLDAPASRGVVIVGILRYIKKHMPMIVLLENVAGLVRRHRDVLNKVVETLEEWGYIVSWRLLDTRTHGALPQRRERVYIVGIKGPATCGTPATGAIPATDGGRIVWPQPVQRISLGDIFEGTPKLYDYNNYKYPALCRNRAINLRQAVGRVSAKALQEGADPASYSVVADLGGQKVQVGYDICHCLTSKRVAENAFFSLQHGRFLTLREYGRLQGVNVDRMKINVSRAQIGAMLGNGFTSTVVARVIAAAIQATERSPVPLEGNVNDGIGYDTPAFQPRAASCQPHAAGQTQATPTRLSKR